MFDKEPGLIWQADIQDAWTALEPSTAVAVRCRHDASLLVRVEVAATDALVTAPIQMVDDDTARAAVEHLRDQTTRQIAESGTGTLLGLWWLEHAPDPITPWCSRCERSRSIQLDRIMEGLGVWQFDRKRNGAVSLRA